MCFMCCAMEYVLPSAAFQVAKDSRPPPAACLPNEGHCGPSLHPEVRPICWHRSATCVCYNLLTTCPTHHCRTVARAVGFVVAPARLVVSWDVPWHIEQPAPEASVKLTPKIYASRHERQQPASMAHDARSGLYPHSGLPGSPQVTALSPL
jgi:hypothetical protein